MLKRPWKILTMIGFLTTAPASLAATRLNNFVTELLNVSPAAGEHTFVLADESWVFIRVTGTDAVDIRLSAIDDSVMFRPGPATGTHETMRLLKPGEHGIRVTGRADRLEVRRVPEIMFNKYQYDPWVMQEGTFDWAFLEAHVLPHVNTICGMRGEDQSDRAVAWRAKGGRWIIESVAPGLQFGRSGFVDRQEVLSVDQIVAGLTEKIRFDTPWMDGQLVDEYYPSLKELFMPTLAAVERVHADPKYRGKRIDLYVAGEPKEMSELLVGGVRIGCKLAFEAYNCEQPSEADAVAYLQKRLPDRMREYAAIVPEAPRHIIVCPGMLSTPPESLDIYPHVSYRVFQDMEFHLMANDPSFDGLFGLMAYTCGYSDADTVRWLGRLYRHYCIEGRTDRLTNEPYILPYLDNPDFADGLAGWDAEPAETGSIALKTVKGLGSMEARMGSRDAGDQCVVMRRSSVRPNAVSQMIRSLKPGQEYVLKVFSTSLVHRDGGYGNPNFDDVNTVWVRLDGVEPLPERSYRHTYRSIHTKGMMFFNYHVHRFRAGTGTARVTISDWQSPEQRVGNPGREAGFNFVEVEPCLN